MTEQEIIFIRLNKDDEFEYDLKTRNVDGTDLDIIYELNPWYTEHKDESQSKEMSEGWIWGFKIKLS